MPRTRPAKRQAIGTSTSPHHVVMLCYPDTEVLDITGPLDVFAHCARWLELKRMARAPVYKIELVGLKAGSFVTSSGMRLVAERSYRDVTSADTLLIAGGTGCDDVMQNQDVLRWIRQLAPKVTRLGSVCTGAMILASTGLLDNKSATTHWDYVDKLIHANPSIKVQPDAIYVRDGNIYTSAGVTAGIDMALAMVEEDWGQRVALAVARILVMFLKRPGGQSQFSKHLAAQFSEDDNLHKLQLWLLNNLDQDISVPALARRVMMSDRNFSRRFIKIIGMTPARYISKVRIEAARRKLEESGLQISQVARHCGFGSGETMRRKFVSELGVTPSDYRARFQSARRKLGRK